MEQKARLVELLERHHDASHELTAAMLENLADYLLKNGIMVPLRQVGESLYVIEGGEVWGCKVSEVTLRSDGTQFIHAQYYDEHLKIKNTHITNADFGSTVFFTREKAEAALEDRKKLLR